MERMKHTVSADHKIAKWACDNETFETGQDRGSGWFYASHPRYGMSKTYRTRRDAIYGMLQDHACTNIRIRD